MNAAKIILPDFLIADLYKSSLVYSDLYLKKEQALAKENLTPEPETAVSDKKIKYTGENLRNVTIVINQPNSIHLNKNDLTFLTNILKACGLNLKDVATVNVSEQLPSFAKIKNQLSPQQIILFEADPSSIKLPFTIPNFQVQIFDNTTIMAAPSLSALNKPDNEGRLLKTRLWSSLKQMFNI